MLTRYDIIARQKLTDQKPKTEPTSLDVSDGLSGYEKNYLNFLKEQMKATKHDPHE